MGIHREDFFLSIWIFYLPSQLLLSLTDMAVTLVTNSLKENILEILGYEVLIVLFLL